MAFKNASQRGAFFEKQKDDGSISGGYGHQPKQPKLFSAIPQMPKAALASLPSLPHLPKVPSQPTSSSKFPNLLKKMRK